MDLEKLWAKADSLNGCLSHLSLKESRRRHETDEDPLNIRDPFISDKAKLLSSKTFRAMSGKTQVFTFPRSPLVRSRKDHVMEVIACSIIASEMLGLNTDLVEAAAIGHDIGHVPFGHQGESWMAKTMSLPFCHEIMGPIIAQKIERKGRGLNLTWHTLEAMMCHSGKMAREGMSQESWLLRYTDKFTYIFHDYNDIVGRMKFQVKQELKDLINFFGSSQRERVTTAISGLVIESAETGRISFEKSEIGQKFNRLRSLMYELYPRVTNQNVDSIMRPVLEFLKMLKIGDPFLLLALMIDKDVAELSKNPMPDAQAFKETSVSEIAPYLDQVGRIDLCDPDLNW